MGSCLYPVGSQRGCERAKKCAANHARIESIPSFDNLSSNASWNTAACVGGAAPIYSRPRSRASPWPSITMTRIPSAPTLPTVTSQNSTLLHNLTLDVLLDSDDQTSVGHITCSERQHTMSSIGSTLNSISSSLLSEIDSYLSTQPTSGSTSTNASNATPSDGVDFSQVAQLFKELQKLQSTDPAEFKKVLTDAAKKLKDAAGQQSDSMAASFLTNLADKFQQAADTGDLSVLKPPAPGSAYGPPPRSSSNTTSSDTSNTQDLLAALLKNLHADSSDGNANLLAGIFSNNS